MERESFLTPNMLYLFLALTKRIDATDDHKSNNDDAEN
jgi:hypothetical protein